MSAVLRDAVTRALKSFWPVDMPIFGENEPVRGERLERLDLGYLRVRLVPGDPDQPDLIGRSDHTHGLVHLAVALPFGKGMAAADNITQLLQTKLANQRFAGLRFADLEIGAGQKTGDFWIFDCEVSFAIWDISSATWPEETQ